jgi:hypothetical protein
MDVNGRSGRGRPRNRPPARQQAAYWRPDPHGQGSFRPSLSVEATPCRRARRGRRALRSSPTGTRGDAYWSARNRPCDSRSRSWRGMTHLRSLRLPDLAPGSADDSKGSTPTNRSRVRSH